MRKISIIMGMALALAACSDDEPTTGSLSVAVLAHADIAAAVTSVTVTLAPSGATRTMTEWNGDALNESFSDVPVGDTTVTAEAFGAEGLVASAAVTTAVAKDQAALAMLHLAPADGFHLAGLSASNDNPDTTQTVTLTASVADAAGSAATFTWSDDCQGEFLSTEGATATWENKWEESCTVTVEASFAGHSDSAELQIDSRYAKGTAVRFAGTTCSWGGTFWNSPGGNSGMVPAVSYGEGGPAIAATIGNALGVAVGPDGNVYFPDREGGRVWMVDGDGILHRVSGSVEGSLESYGDGLTAATHAGHANPTDVALDAEGNIFVTDYWGSGIRRIDAQTGIIEAVAGDTPFGLSLHASGDLFIAHSGSVHRVYAVMGTNTTLSTDFTRAFNLVQRPNGRLLVADRRDHQVKELDPATGVVEIFAGTGDKGFSGDGGAATDAQLREPYSVAIAPSGDVYIVDGHNARIRRVDSAGNITTVVGPELNPGPGYVGLLGSPVGSPTGIAFNAAGDMFVGSRHGCMVTRVAGPW